MAQPGLLVLTDAGSRDGRLPSLCSGLLGSNSPLLCVITAFLPKLKGWAMYVRMLKDENKEDPANHLGNTVFTAM